MAKIIKKGDGGYFVSGQPLSGSKLIQISFSGESGNVCRGVIPFGIRVNINCRVG
ncbi:hypothetical protein [Methylocaldum sp. RMAD-M]|uniref:hypothetical protein n=1 Tax=Methylocaldum sp. RMAD-M TaxID=2806557 RepID=UPI001AE3DD22|nr:hypothetical protein [Methylocaldum sp. RMAD-M]